MEQMDMARRRTMQVLAGSLLASLAATGARAQEMKLAQARILAGFPAGGAVDAVARRIADSVRGKVAETVLVDNRAGAGGRLAIDALRNGPSDGSQWLLTPGSMLTIYPHVYRKLSYDPARDLQPVGLVGTVPLALIVGPAVPTSVTDVRSYLAWLRSEPSKSNIGSPALGNVTHFLCFLLERAADLKMPVVAYRGSAPAVQDLLGGHVPALLNPITDVLPHLASNRLRILGVTSKTRTHFAPGVPTFVEQGYDQVIGSEWLGLFTHAQTPRPLVDRMGAALRGALKTPPVIESFEKLAIEPADADGAALSRQIASETATWREVSKALGFHLDD